VTYARKEYSENNTSVLSADINFESGTNQTHSQNQKLLGSQANDSKIQRRHRIFDASSKSPSVSPNTKVVSPLGSVNPQQLTSSSIHSSKHSSKIINPLTKSKPA
jgi:type II secretory pathway component PulC